MSALSSREGSCFQCVRVVRMIGPGWKTSHSRSSRLRGVRPRLWAHQRCRTTCKWKLGEALPKLESVAVKPTLDEQTLPHYLNCRLPRREYRLLGPFFPAVESSLHPQELLLTKS